MKGQTTKNKIFRELNKDDLSLLGEFLFECKNEHEQEEVSRIFVSSSHLKDWKSFRNEKAWDKIQNKISDKPRISWYKYAAAIIVLVCSTIALNYFADDTKSIVAEKSGKNIVLEDGSDIILGADSEIKFDEKFNLENRTIELKGNAYFDIAKNQTMPFIVKTESTELTVIGTKFYVSMQENGAKVDVLEGKVKVYSASGKSQIITDNQSAVIDNDIIMRQSDQTAFSLDKYVDLKFDNAKVQDAIDTLNKIYAKEVIVLNKDIKDLGTETIHTTIRNSSVKDFIRFMEIVFDVNVINSKGQYIISLK
jgi:ferric-dicitrate binding protein FerR (iron transport regulator)